MKPHPHIRQKSHDYGDHPATDKVRRQKSISDWVLCIETLVAWAAIDDLTATNFNSLRKLRNKSVHFGEHLSGTDGRDDALSALELVQAAVEALFSPIGRSPRFIEGTAGHFFLSIDSEAVPLIKHFYLPACVLVSPGFEMRPVSTHSGMGFSVFDDENYQTRFPRLSDIGVFEVNRAWLVARPPGRSRSVTGGVDWPGFGNRRRCGLPT